MGLQPPSQALLCRGQVQVAGSERAQHLPGVGVTKRWEGSIHDRVQGSVAGDGLVLVGEAVHRGTHQRLGLFIKLGGQDVVDCHGEPVADSVGPGEQHRIPELLAIMVNHSLGSQTLELASAAFDERAARLAALTVRHVDDLVLDAQVVGTDATATLGHGPDQDLYLHQPTSSAPVLFHDLTGPDWVDRLRRKIAPHLAAVLANPAYTHTIALFLQADSDAEREEFLLELGISADDVDTVAARLGVVGQEQRQHHLRWFQAILTALGHPVEQLTLDPTTLTTALLGAGLPDGLARAVVEAGGGDTTRRDTAEGSPLRLLAAAGLDPADLDTALHHLGDDGLHLSVTRRMFNRWLAVHDRRVVAALATRQDPDTAKTLVRNLQPPPDLALALDPDLPQVLAPVVDLLANAGLQVAAVSLATDPPATLAHLAGQPSVAALDATAAALYDEAEQHRLRRERAAQWRREIRTLAVLARMGPAETRATVRAHDEQVATVLPGPHSTPSDLIDPVGELFVEHTRVRDWLTDQLADHQQATHRTTTPSWPAPASSAYPSTDCPSCSAPWTPPAGTGPAPCSSAPNAS